MLWRSPPESYTRRQSEIQAMGKMCCIMASLLFVCQESTGEMACQTCIVDEENGPLLSMHFMHGSKGFLR